jgi:hypothetical protein
MHTGTFEKLSGHVEADETFVWQGPQYAQVETGIKITGTGGKDKTIVMGVLERGKDGKPSQVRTSVVSSRKNKVLQSEVRQHVAAGSALYTDALKSYDGLTEFED